MLAAGGLNAGKVASTLERTGEMVATGLETLAAAPEELADKPTSPKPLIILPCICSRK